MEAGEEVVAASRGAFVSLNELQECGAEEIGALLRNGYLLCLCAYTEV